MSSLNNQSVASPIYIGIDMGTSGIRLCGIDEEQRPVIELSVRLPDSQIDENLVWQNPADWQTGLFALLKELDTKTDLTQLKAIAIDGTSGTVLLADKLGRPVSKALMYNDASSPKQVDRLKKLTKNSVVQTVSAGLPKILALAEQHPEFNYFMHQTDWINSLLCGRLNQSDSNNCLKSGYDPIAREWPSWFDQLPALQDKLPQVHMPGDILGPILPDIARQFHLPPSTLVIAGTTDSHAAILATGIRHTGEAVTSLGSTLVTKVISVTPIFDQTSGVYSQPFGDKWLVGGGSNTGGAILRKYFSDAQMLAMTDSLDPDTDTTLDYYPLLKPGERFPINDPELAPKLSPRPVEDTKFFQGMLEGIARIERDAYRRLQELGAPYPDLIKTVGGGAKNDKWTRIRQRYCQTPVEQSQYTEASYGSALLARQGMKQVKG